MRQAIRAQCTPMETYDLQAKFMQQANGNNHEPDLTHVHRHGSHKHKMPRSSTVLFKYHKFMCGTEPLKLIFKNRNGDFVSSPCDVRLTLQLSERTHDTGNGSAQQAVAPASAQPKNPVGQKEPEPTTSRNHPENIPSNERALCDSGIQLCRQPSSLTL